LDDEGDEINVEDSSDLVRAYKYSEMVSNNKNVLKFLVSTYERSQEEMMKV